MYEVLFLAQAANDLENLDRPIAHRIMRRIKWLAEHFTAVRPENLTGPLAGLLKLRVGDYRVIYEADREQRTLTVHAVGHRREVYDLP